MMGMGIRHSGEKNLFSSDSTCSLAVTFSANGLEYLYAIKYNTGSSEYVYERFAEVQRDKYGNRKEKVWLLRNCLENKNESEDEKLADMMELASKGNLLMHVLDTSRFPMLDRMKNLLVAFAESIDVIDIAGDKVMIDFETGKTEKEKAEEKEEKQMQLQVAKMHEMMLAINSTFQRKQEAAEKAKKPKE